MSSAPAVLGKYQLVRKLASGGMAEVFLARAAGPMGFEKQVVVKRILPHLADEQNFISMFLSEARLAAQLNHPNVVQVFDFGETDGSYFLVMEFIDGVNLRVLFRKAQEQSSPLPFTFVARIISQACEGLAYAHDFVDPADGQPMGLVHRDVSPDNVLIARNGSVRVVDFGIAKAANQTNLTKTGTVKGKFSYMPPEQLTGQPLDRRADVFALGIVMYELLTGRKPFDTSNEAFIVRAIMYEAFAPASQFRHDVPEALQRILDKALAKSREERYADCRELQSDLERFILQQGEPVSQYQLSQLVQRLAPPAAPTAPLPQPSAPPAPPMGAPPQAATVEDVDLSTALLATPPPQPSVIALVPKAKSPTAQPPPPPVPTQTGLAAPQVQLNPKEPLMPPQPNVPPSSDQFPMLPPPAPAPTSVGAQMTAPDLGSISVRGESREAPKPAPAPKKNMMVPVVLGTLVLGSLVAIFALKAMQKEPPPEGVAVVMPAKPEPVAVKPEPEPVKPEPVAVQPEPVKPEPEPVKPEPVAAVQPEPAKPEPEPMKAEPVAAVPVKKGTPPKIAPKVKPPPPVTTAVAKAGVEFRVRPFGAVWVDGNYLGETPFAPAQLGVGVHSVRVVNRDLGKEVTRQFEVKDGSNVFRHNFEE